jgi:hypothetical protein
MSTQIRPLSEVAHEVYETWPKVNYAAKPYLTAMEQLDLITDAYGADSAASIVRYFLSNATGWRGEDAKRIKAELKEMIKGVY